MEDITKKLMEIHKIDIPIVNRKDDKSNTLKDTDFFLHKVQKGEHLYDIAVMYSIDIEHLIEYNLAIRESGRGGYYSPWVAKQLAIQKRENLKAGLELKIPIKFISEHSMLRRSGKIPAKPIKKPIFPKKRKDAKSEFILRKGGSDSRNMHNIDLDIFLFNYFKVRKISINGWNLKNITISSELAWEKNGIKILATPFWDGNYYMDIIQDDGHMAFNIIEQIDLYKWYIDIIDGDISVYKFIEYYLNLMSGKLKLLLV